jgi:hypothetical protein
MKKKRASRMASRSGIPKPNPSPSPTSRLRELFEEVVVSALGASWPAAAVPVSAGLAAASAVRVVSTMEVVVEVGPPEVAAEVVGDADVLLERPVLVRRTAKCLLSSEQPVQVASSPFSSRKYISLPKPFRVMTPVNHRNVVVSWGWSSAMAAVSIGITTV